MTWLKTKPPWVTRPGGTLTTSLTNYRQPNPPGTGVPKQSLNAGGYGATTDFTGGGPGGLGAPVNFSSVEPIVRSPFVSRRPQFMTPRLSGRFYVLPPGSRTSNPWEVPTNPWEKPPYFKLPSKPSPPNLTIPDYRFGPGRDWQYPV